MVEDKGDGSKVCSEIYCDQFLSKTARLINLVWIWQART
jgi:hypothetical protein